MLPTLEAVTKITEDVHGSGINGDWHIKETRTSYRISNFFSTMTEYGYYDVDVDFTVIFPKDKDMRDFRLMFTSTQEYYVGKYALREYLDDTIREYLDDTIAFAVDKIPWWMCKHD